MTASLALQVLRGRKTQTRRLMSEQPVESHGGFSFASCWWSASVLDHELSSGCKTVRRCPLGVPGDELWLREPALLHRVSGDLDYAGIKGGYRVQVQYVADGAVSQWMTYPKRLAVLRVGHRISNGCYREASRFRATVRQVRIQRLSSVSEAECIAEGWDESIGVDPRHWFDGVMRSIYGDEAIDMDPWLWVVHF